jgi:GNAT superfamily N-acetyltransferase
VAAVTVRSAVPADAEGITDVHLHGWEWGYADLMPAGFLAARAQTRVERIEGRRESISEPGANQTFVALIGDEIVGFTNAGRYRNNQKAEDLNPGEGEVYAIYVSRAVAGTGVGRALMDATVHWLRGRGLYPIRLWVLEGNARARAFYERYGFRLDGDRSTFTLEQTGELPIELAEVRFTLGA